MDFEPGIDKLTGIGIRLYAGQTLEDVATQQGEHLLLEFINDVYLANTSLADLAGVDIFA